MSVDDTIRELARTIGQLGLLMGRISEQVGGISSRINITLQTFDDSVSGIAKDANKMTEQVDNTIAQIPGNWAFYLLFFTLLSVLFLLSVLIIINLVLKIQSLCRIMRGESSRSSTPLQPFVHSESKQPLHPSMIGGIHSGGYSYPSRSREQVPIESSRHIAVEMESEPRRYGIGPSAGGGFSGRTTSTVGPTIYHQPSSHQRSATTLAPMEFYGNGKGGPGSPNSGMRGRPTAGEAPDQKKAMLRSSPNFKFLSRASSAPNQKPY